MAEGCGSLTCAICFEDFDEATPLPCSCKIDYCVKCWDKALASSFRNTHQPRCPTCRAPIRVDFDAERRRLVFSLERGPVLDISDLSELQSRAAQGSVEAEREFHQLSQGLSESLEEIVERLAQQAIPAQTRLLEDFGASNPELGDLARAEDLASGVLVGLSIAELKRHVAALGGATEGCLERADVLSRLREVAGGSWAAVASYWASAGGAPPRAPKRCRRRTALRVRRQLEPGLRPGEGQPLVRARRLRAGHAAVRAGVAGRAIARHQWRHLRHVRRAGAVELFCVDMPGGRRHHSPRAVVRHLRPLLQAAHLRRRHSQRRRREPSARR